MGEMYNKLPPASKQRMNSLLVVISGPSGVGKDAVLARMKKMGCPFHFVVTATTRHQRKGERGGVDYRFVAEEEFNKMIDSGQLLEWAKVYGNYYGVPKAEVAQALNKGQDVVVKVDVQGATTIKQLLPQAVFIFLMPPSMEELTKRLRWRHSETSAELNLRLERAKDEIKSLPLFDYVITNYEGRLDGVISQIKAIVTAEKCRVKPRVVKL